MTQFQANLGNSVILGRSTHVEDQYAQPSAKGNFQGVFDSPRDPNDSQLRIYNLVTWLGTYKMPNVIDERLAILGKLVFGIGGATMEVDFDWKVGTQLSLAASYLRVEAAYSEIGSGSPNEVRIAAMIASGSRAARSQVTRTYPRLLVDSDHTVLFPIPAYAHALNLFADDTDFYGADAVRIRYVGGANNGISTASTSLEVFNIDGVPFLNGLSTEDGVRFPEAAKWVEISTEGEGQFQVTPCFTLSF